MRVIQIRDSDSCKNKVDIKKVSRFLPCVYDINMKMQTSLANLSIPNTDGHFYHV